MTNDEIKWKNSLVRISIISIISMAILCCFCIYQSHEQSKYVLDSIYNYEYDYAQPVIDIDQRMEVRP